MEMKDNVVRLTEQEFQELVGNAVLQVMTEGRFGKFAKKVGKGLAKGALYGALGAGSLYAIDKGLQNQEAYERELNRQAKILQGPTEDEVSRYIEDHEMEDTPQNREEVWEWLNDELQNESRQSRKINRIIREEISKVLA